MLDWIRDGEGDKLGHQHLMSSQEVATQHSQETLLQKLKYVRSNYHWNHTKIEFRMIPVAIWYEYHTSVFAVNCVLI